MKAASSLALVTACAAFVLNPVAGSGTTPGGNALPAATQHEPAAAGDFTAATRLALVTRPGWNYADHGVRNERTSDDTRVMADQMSFAPSKRRPALQVGENYDPAKVHLVTEPGRYGLGTPPQGSQYAVIDSYLVRVEPVSMKVLSVIRLVNEILD